MDNKKKIIVIVGASGSGKTTLANELAVRGIPRVVTTTTREKRPGEVDGVDYFFRTQEEIKVLSFVENIHYNGNVYGLTEESINQQLNQNDEVCVVMDYNGAIALKERYPDETQIIYLVVTKQTMIERMTERGDTSEMIQERLDTAEKNGELTIPRQIDIVISSQDLQVRINQLVKCL